MQSFEGLFCVDAFAGSIGTGNPAGVCLLEQEADAGWMQVIAREMNHSETSFVVPGKDGFLLRWFTPRVEVELAGHPTLAAAHVLWEEGWLDADQPVRFFTKSGELTAWRKGDLIELDFPQVAEEPAAAPPGLLDSLGVHPVYTGKNRFDWIVELETEHEVRSLYPDFARLAMIPMRGVIVTARSGKPGIDFVSRFFAPAVGVNEDPVTGSAHCCLAPFWQKRLGKDALVACQVSERGGMLILHVIPGGRVTIAGRALTVWKGALQQ